MSIDFFSLTASQTNPENRTMLPKLAFTSFASRYRAPKLEEGFGEIIKVDFEVSATPRYLSYWTGVRNHTSAN